MSTLEADVKAFFDAQGGRATPIPTESKQKNRTPDLLVSFRGLELVVEIKEIKENEMELKVLTAVNAGKLDSHSRPDDTKRFAKKIRDANNQLKTKCKGRPGLALLADTRSFLVRPPNCQQILAEAMFGRQTIWRTAPHPSIRSDSKTVSHDFGLDRTLSPEANTTTSAVALMLSGVDDEPVLLLHHNPHAAVPIPHGVLRSKSIREFVIPSTKDYSNFQELVGSGLHVPSSPSQLDTLQDVGVEQASLDDADGA